ncbi:TetR/AcrR family transcriptional regulator [Chitinimonas sp. BJB300]|uniref:TetR/AcrR family transcriptional regulator n=1 Tax=Chitinimonas sp. BJB300 TaxID=1559339 RepID=UPI000C0F2BD1|nr:TetR/AcrR family transcriptional regulator [Chitinimonas sp. BJB300]PHV11463.1 TetR family transcriptional regulator [Chitinimonas sp. BJB300]TSJ87211.1 TetR/AcrR family transcriptional regulator [Chitinimonas sp. BJB300]
MNGTGEIRQTDTATRILDAAEVLFVEHGFEATSMRMITQRAEVNLAAVNYHFGSKDALFQGVFTRRLTPLTQLAVQSLDKLEQAAKGAPLLVDAIMHAFMDAALDIAYDPKRGGVIFVRLLSRTFVETHPVLRESLPRHYEELVGRYASATARALPHIDQIELQWRLNFAFSAIFNAFAGNNILRLFVSDPVVNARDPRLIATYLVPFVVAGLTAPAVKMGASPDVNRA